MGTNKDAFFGRSPKIKNWSKECPVTGENEQRMERMKRMKHNMMIGHGKMMAHG